MTHHEKSLKRLDEMIDNNPNLTPEEVKYIQGVKKVGILAKKFEDQVKKAQEKWNKEKRA
jgi:hypothetical protein